MTTSTAAPAATPTLTGHDRCDRCGAAAKARAVLPTGGELLFCGHHARRHAAGLHAAGAHLVIAATSTPALLPPP